MTTGYMTAAAARDIEARLTEQDFAVLRRVCNLRFVSGDQLTRLYFADGDAASKARAARRALLRLTSLGVLERLPRVVGGARAGSAGYVYRLGLAGQRLALERGWLPDRRRRRERVPGTLFVDHALQVAELHTQLVEAERFGQIELLELASEPVCHRRYGQQAILKPDSYVRLGSGEFEDSYFIEVDRGTEGSRALDRQLRAYVAYYDAGREQAERGVFPRVLWLAPDTRRVRAIESCVKRLPRPARELFQVAPFAEAIRVVSNTSKELLKQS